MIPNGMIFQNDPRLEDVFRKEGCRARSLMAMAEIVVGRAMNIVQLQMAIATGEKDESVLAGSTATAGENEHKLSYYVFMLLEGSERYCRQVGVWKDGQWIDWHGNVIDPKLVAFSELHWQTDYPAGHFTIGDCRGVEVWDSWSTAPDHNPWNRSGEVGYTINKRSITGMWAYRLFEGVVK